MASPLSSVRFTSDSLAHNSPFLAEGVTTNTPENTILAQSVLSQILTAVEEAAAQAKVTGTTKLAKRQVAEIGDILSSIISVSQFDKANRQLH